MSTSDQQRTFPPGFSSSGVTSVDQKLDDPVSRAIVNNIMGKVPTTKKVAVQCTICDIHFSSDIPYQMHLNGARHAKKVKSLEILDLLKEDGAAIKADNPNSLSCDVCGVSVNSSQQMQLHLTGAKHRGKASRMKTDDDENNDSADNGSSSQPPSKKAMYNCETCILTLNSEQQLQQHMASIKHKNKEQGVVVPSKKAQWWKNKKKSGLGFTGNQNSGEESSTDIPPLSGTFVSGESDL